MDFGNVLGNLAGAYGVSRLLDGRDSANPNPGLFVNQFAPALSQVGAGITGPDTGFSSLNPFTGALSIDPLGRNLNLHGLEQFANNLGGTRDALTSGNGAFVNARVSPLLERIEAGRGGLKRSLGRTNVRGTFADRSLQDFDINASRAEGDARAIAERETLNAVNQIDQLLFGAETGVGQNIFNQEMSALGLSAEVVNNLRSIAANLATGSGSNAVGSARNAVGANNARNDLLAPVYGAAIEGIGNAVFGGGGGGLFSGSAGGGSGTPGINPSAGGIFGGGGSVFGDSGVFGSIFGGGTTSGGIGTGVSNLPVFGGSSGSVPGALSAAAQPTAAAGAQTLGQWAGSSAAGAGVLAAVDLLQGMWDSKPIPHVQQMQKAIDSGDPVGFLTDMVTSNKADVLPGMLNTFGIGNTEGSLWNRVRPKTGVDNQREMAMDNLAQILESSPEAASALTDDMRTRLLEHLKTIPRTHGNRLRLRNMRNLFNGVNNG